MNRYDVQMNFTMEGTNQFGKVEHLTASRIRNVEAESEEQAIDIAKALEPNIDIITFSVCKR